MIGRSTSSRFTENCKNRARVAVDNFSLNCRKIISDCYNRCNSFWVRHERLLAVASLLFSWPILLAFSGVQMDEQLARLIIQSGITGAALIFAFYGVMFANEDKLVRGLEAQQFKKELLQLSKRAVQLFALFSASAGFSWVWLIFVKGFYIRDYVGYLSVSTFTVALVYLMHTGLSLLSACYKTLCDRLNVKEDEQRMRILLQFPEGLKAEAVAKARALEAQGNEVLLSASPCYGACDVATAQAKALGADKIIHYGHSQFMSTDVPVEYVEYPQKVDCTEVINKALGMLDAYHAVGLVTTVQHVAQLPEIKKLLEKGGKKVVIGKHGARAKHDGQVLGCDQGAAQSVERGVDCFLYFGGGIFHPLGVALAVQKPVLAADPFLKKVFWLDETREKFAKRRKGALLKALEAKRFGILISTKPGQFALSEARTLRNALREAGREAYMLVADEIVPEALENFRAFDCYINTACPRIVEDQERFAKPVLNAGEAREMLRMI